MTVYGVTPNGTSDKPIRENPMNRSMSSANAIGSAPRPEQNSG